MRILQLMGFPINEIIRFVDDNNEYHGHNLYGYLDFRKNKQYSIKVIPDTIPAFWAKNILTRRIYTQFLVLKYLSKTDLIYSPHDIHIIILAILKALHIIKVPILMVCHFSYNMKYVPSFKTRQIKKLERYLVYKYIEQIVFASENLLKLAINDYPVPARHRKIVYWGGALKFFDKYKLNIRREPKLNYFAAMGRANRNYNILINTFKNINSSLKILAGNISSSYSDIPHNVEFIDLSEKGLAGMCYLREYYYDCIAVLLPIKQINDVPNGATVLIEALAMGKPIIVTDLDTNYINVEKEKVGLSVKENTPEGWANAINYLLDNPLVVKQMGINAYNLAKSKYNLERFEHNISEYFDLLNKSLLS